MQELNDRQRAARYRRKLEDLWSASGDFVSRLPRDHIPADARESFERLLGELRVVRNQLDTENAVRAGMGGGG